MPASRSATRPSSPQSRRDRSRGWARRAIAWRSNGSSSVPPKRRTEDGMYERVERAVALLHDRGLDGILVTNPTNRRYLSGFTADDHGFDESSGVLLIDASNQLLLTGGTNLPWAIAEADGFTTDAWSRP